MPVFCSRDVFAAATSELHLHAICSLSCFQSAFLEQSKHSEEFMPYSAVAAARSVCISAVAGRMVSLGPTYPLHYTNLSSLTYPEKLISSAFA